MAKLQNSIQVLTLFTSELSEDLNYGPWSYAM